MQIIEAHKDNYILKCQFSFDDVYLATCSSDRTCKIFRLETVESYEQDEDGNPLTDEILTSEEYKEESVSF